MKLLFALTLSALLVAGCSDSSTQSSSDSVSDNQSGSNTNSGSSGDSTSDTGSGENTGSTSGSGDNTNSGSDSDAGSNDSGSDSGSNVGGGTGDSGSGDSGGGDSGGGDSDDNATVEPEPPAVVEPTLYAFSGSMYQYATVQGNGEPTNDPRIQAIQLAPDHVTAQAAIEAKHALSFYRANLSLDTKIYKMADIQSSCNTLEGNFASGFIKERCRYYVNLAYDKTMAQDGWQASVVDLYAGPTHCRVNDFIHPLSSSANCRFKLTGASGEHSTSSDQFSDYYFLTSQRTENLSPIERWNFIQQNAELRAINTASSKHAFCAGHYTPPQGASGQGGWQSSFWPGQHYTLWIINGDALGDIGEEITAQTPFSRDCNSQLIRELGEIYLN